MNSFFTVLFVLTIRLPAGGLTTGVKSHVVAVLGRLKGAKGEFRRLTMRGRCWSSVRTALALALARITSRNQWP
jgi:hypothetical protein